MLFLHIVSKTLTDSNVREMPQIHWRIINLILKAIKKNILLVQVLFYNILLLLQKIRAILKLKEGLFLRQYAADLNVSHSCISKIKKKCNENHNVECSIGSIHRKVARGEKTGCGTKIS